MTQNAPSVWPTLQSLLRDLRIEPLVTDPQIPAPTGNIYPVHALSGIMAAAHLADAPRGQKDLEAFAQSLSQAQLKALGVRRDGKSRRYPTPDQTTFSRMMSRTRSTGPQ